MTSLSVEADADEATYPWTSYTPADFQSDVTVKGKNIYGTMKFIEGGLSPSGYLSGDGYFLALKFGDKDPNATSFKVGLNPTQGAGMQELDEDMNAVFKVTDKNVQNLVVQVSDGTKTRTDYYDLNTLKESKTGA